MALAVAASGTHTITTLDTEENLNVAITTGKTFVLVVDTANLVDGETVTLKLHTKVLSGGTEREAFIAHYRNVQEDDIKYSPPVPANISIKPTIEQNGGTKRAFAWSLLTLD